MVKAHDSAAIAHSLGAGGAGIPSQLTQRPRWPADLPPCRNGCVDVCKDRGCPGCEARRAWQAKGGRR